MDCELNVEPKKPEPIYVIAMRNRRASECGEVDFV